jgi:PAS domain S-box-containing protein
VLWEYGVMDTPPEEIFDELTALAAQCCETPIALISLLDDHRQWFKSKVGWTVSETARDLSFCTHAIRQQDVFVVRDATQDARFAQNPLVTAEPFVRFYAGAPLITPEGHVLGMVCALDRIARDLQPAQAEGLRSVARVVMTLLNARREKGRPSEPRADAGGDSGTLAAFPVEIAEHLRFGLLLWQWEPPEDERSLRLIALNPAAARMTGVAWATARARRMAEAFPWFLETEIPRALVEALRSNRVQDLEVAHRADAPLADSELSVRVFPLPGRRAGMLLESITDRRLVEQAHVESQARKSAILDSALDGIVTIDHEGRVFEWNAAAEQMFGHRRSAVLGKELATLVFPDADRARVNEGLARYLAHGISPLIGRRIELTARRADGSEFPVEFSMVRVPHSTPPIFTGFISDITERRLYEVALREKEATLLEAQRIGRLGSWELKLDSRELEWSDETYRIFGRARGAFVPTREAFYEALHPADRDRVRQAADEALAGGAGYRVEHRIVRPDGSQRVVHERAELVRDDAGRPVRWLGTVQDITERKQAEEALRASQSLYLSLVESLPQNIYRKDTAGRFTFANSRFCTTLGKSLEDVLGRTDFDFFPASLAEKNQANDRQVMASGQPLEIVEATDMAGAGRRFVQVVKTPLYSPAGAPIGIQGIFWDVTERQRMEEALQRSEEHFRSLIENSSDVIAVINAQGRIVYVSHTVRRILQYEPAALLNEPVIDLIHEDDASRVRESLARALTGPEAPNPVEFRLRRADGLWRHLEAVGQRRRGEDGQWTVVVNARDITERRQLEDQLRHAQKMESVGQLAGGVAHDFNNILTVIQGHASLLLAGESLGPRQTTSVQQINLAAERAANLTRQLLTFSRKQVLQPRALDLNEVVHGMGKMLQRLLGEDISLHLHYSPGLPLARADAGMLEQVLMNLAVNSRDAMPRGGQLVVNTSAVRLTPTDLGPNPDAYAGEFVRLSVTDTGTGIAPEHLPHIFEPFFTTKDVGKGTGLGLATVYGIIKQHRGWITVASEVGKGTVFQVFLPVDTGQASAKAALPTTEDSLRGGSETILIVEDEAAVCELISDLLSKLGYHVLTARSGPVALELWARHRDRIDLLLTDMVMPDGMTGRELGKRLQLDKPPLKVVYTSGYSAEALGSDFQMDPNLVFLQKPYSTRKLAELIRAQLDSG